MEYKYNYLSLDDAFSLTMCCITYNLHGESLSFIQINQLLTAHKNKSCDIYVISTQESQRSILMNLFFWDKSKFEEDLARFFGVDYVRLKPETLGGVHLIIFIKKTHKNNIMNYYKEYIKTGFYGLLGNKGAVGIGFKLYNISFLIINCHLCHGFNNVLYRNDDFDYIKKNIHPNIYKFDIVIWMGDFNYRVNLTMEEAEEIIQNKNELKLLEFDQMNHEIKNYNLKCAGFKEGLINFMPTYKYSDDYPDTLICDSEDHIPSWTDRILYMANENTFHIKENDINNENNRDSNLIESNQVKEQKKDIINEKNKKEKAEASFDLINYNSMQNIEFSDHKPVFAYFNININ